VKFLTAAIIGDLELSKSLDTRTQRTTKFPIVLMMRTAMSRRLFDRAQRYFTAGVTAKPRFATSRRVGAHRVHPPRVGRRIEDPSTATATFEYVM